MRHGVAGIRERDPFPEHDVRRTVMAGRAVAGDVPAVPVRIAHKAGVVRLTVGLQDFSLRRHAVVEHRGNRFKPVVMPTALFRSAELAFDSVEREELFRFRHFVAGGDEKLADVAQAFAQFPFEVADKVVGGLMQGRDCIGIAPVVFWFHGSNVKELAGRLNQKVSQKKRAPCGAPCVSNRRLRRSRRRYLRRNRRRLRRSRRRSG